MGINSPEQKAFDRLYISSFEISQRLGITRPRLNYYRKNGKIPEPVIALPHAGFLWNRKALEPVIAQLEKQVTRTNG